MGMIVDCFLVKVPYDEYDRNEIIKNGIKGANQKNRLSIYSYGVEIPDDMAMQLDHTGMIEESTPTMALVRCYKIDWDETERLRQSDFRFGD